MKIPKHDLSAEQSLLWAMMIDPKIIPEVMSEINSKYFFHTHNEYIYKAICVLSSSNINVDIITVKMQLEKLWKFEEIWGIMYLTELTDIVPTSWNWDSYMNILKDKYYLRSIMNIGYKIQDDVTKDIDPMEILNMMQEEIKNTLSTVVKVWNKTLAELLYQRYEELAEILDQWPDYIDNSIKTWYKFLDALLGWLKWWNLFIIAARPWMWKTTLALNISDYCVKEKKRVAFFSLEMSEQEITDRIISLYSDVNAFRLRVWKITADDLNEIALAHERISDLKLEIDATPVLTPATLRSKLLRMTMHAPIDLIVVDYLQLMKEPWVQNRVQEVSEISRQLKLLAKEFDVPMIALSQLSRALETRPCKIPQMSDLRESGSIEQDADQIAFLYREEYYDEFSDKKWIVEIHLKKNRHWSIWKIDLYFDKSKQRMLNISQAWAILDMHWKIYQKPVANPQMSIS